jgi:hypothetical protein
MKLGERILSQGLKVSMFVWVGTCLMAGCNTMGESKALSNWSETRNIESTNSFNATQTVARSDKLASFKGVDLHYDGNVIESVKVQDVPEYIPKEGLTYMPDAFEARHLNFKFTGASIRDVRQGDYPAEINIYSVAEYKRSALRTGEYYEELPNNFQNLQNVLSGNQSSVRGGDYPFIPWIGAGQVIHAHREFIPFKNGNGIGYLTQFTMDVDLINNDKLLYVFQGMTRDNKYFISATFPVRTSYLPDDRLAETYKSYTLPDNFYAPERRDQNLQEYDRYLLEVQAELENTNSEDFKPSLVMIQRLLSSMEVRPTIFNSK